jgi:DNA modification methylase
MTENKDLYTIICGDCTESSNLPNENEKVDLIIFDPPFKPKKTKYKQIDRDLKNKLDQISTPEDYNSWFESLCYISAKLLKDNGWFIFKSDDFTAREVYHITQKSFNYSYSVIWDKGRIGLGRKYRKQHEIIEIYTHYDQKQFWSQAAPHRKRMNCRDLTGKKVTIKLKKKWHGSSRGIAFPSVIKIPNFNSGTLGEDPHEHINQTPEQLWYHFLKYCCPENGTVLDLTAGTFSILKAVKFLNEKEMSNRKYWGIEIVKEDCKKAKLLIDNPESIENYFDIKSAKAKVGGN